MFATIFHSRISSRIPKNIMYRRVSWIVPSSVIFNPPRHQQNSCGENNQEYKIPVDAVHAPTLALVNL